MGLLLCAWVLYNLYAPAFISAPAPIQDTLTPGEFLRQPNYDDAHVEQAKELLKHIFNYGAGKGDNVLLFPQDYLEARPTGGFPGTYLYFTATNGDISNLRFDDIWRFDNPLRESNQPELNQYAWWSHFPQAARYASAVYTKNTGQQVDTVLALDPTAIKYLLRGIGPVDVPEFSDRVDADNITEKILSYSPYVKNRLASAKHKLFMGAIVQAIEKRLSTYETFTNRSEIAKGFLRSLEEKHTLVYSQSKSVQVELVENNWAGAINGPGDTDFLAVRDYNAGINKADAYLDRNIDYAVTLTQGKEALSSLTIKYRYKYDSAFFNKYGPLSEAKTRQYKNILRVYVPAGAKLRDSRGYSGFVKEGKEAGKKVFEGLVTLNPGQSRLVTLKYVTPLKQTTAYRLVVSKQPGLPILNKQAPKLRVEVRMAGKPIEAYFPEYSSYNAKRIAFDTDLAFDRYVKLRFAAR